MRIFWLFAGKEKNQKNMPFKEEEDKADELQQDLLN